MKSKKKIISINRDSEFFFRAGMRCVERRKFSNALRFLSKAAEIEPFNADYQFNLACVLAELKEVKKSNDKLLDILKNIDPTLTECYFGIACNYFDLENYKKSREYLEKYIYLDPDGSYVDEAYDILFYLQIYEDVGINKNAGQKVTKYSNEGTRLLDEGNYPKARYYLEKAIEIDPDVISPRNNLSLVHFFMEDVDKAISLARSSLKLEPENVFALCNLAIFYAYKKDTAKYDELIRELSELEIDSSEELSKTVNTFKILKEHNCIVSVLIKYLRKHRDPFYFHLLSVGLFNIKRFDFAEEIWTVTEESFPQFKIITKYFRALNRDTENGALEYKVLEYSNKLPEQIESECKEKFNKSMQLETTLLEKMWKSDSEIKDIILYYIYEGSQDEKVMAVNNLAKIGSQEIVQLLTGIAEDEDSEEKIKGIISKVLGLKRNREKTKTFPKESDVDTINSKKISSLEWKKEWEAVIDCALQKKEVIYKSSYKNELKSILMNFISKSHYGNSPDIKRKEIWAATLEYLYCNLHLIRVSKKQIAKKYNVSPSSITNRLKDF